MFSKLAALCMISAVSAAPAEDKVESIPNMETFPYGVYSGYLPIEDTKKSLHYLFVESENSPEQDPLVIWFNGGPGCSSLLGWAQELGPWVFDDDTEKWSKNDYSWNKFANVLFVEAPAGVGYSVCGDKSECKWDDENSADDNFKAVLSWFQDKFPEYAKHDLYVSGESYAGIYVPQLSWRIHQHNQKTPETEFRFNFKGWMIGNGVTNWKYDATPAFIEMAYWHGLMDMDMHEEMNSKCDFSYVDVDDSKLSDECNTLLQTFYNNTDVIDPYDVYHVTKMPSESENSHAENKLGRFFGPIQNKLEGVLKKFFKQDLLDSSDLLTNKLNKVGKNYTPFLHRKKVQKLRGEGPCPYLSPLTEYFQSGEVKKALHIPDFVQDWDQCQMDIDYTETKRASQWIYEELHKEDTGYRYLKYSGDTDGAVPTLGTERWINSLGWKVTEKYRPFYLNKMEIAGYIEQREGNFTFATVHGAGHMVPEFKRPESFYLIKNWIQGNKI